MQNHVPILIPKTKANGKWLAVNDRAEIRHGLNTIAFQNMCAIQSYVKWNEMKWPNSICSHYCLCLCLFVCLFLKWQFTNSLECSKLRNKWIIIRCRQFFFIFSFVFFAFKTNGFFPPYRMFHMFKCSISSIECRDETANARNSKDRMGKRQKKTRKKVNEFTAFDF